MAPEDEQKLNVLMVRNWTSILDAIQSTSVASQPCLIGRTNGLKGLSKAPVSVRGRISMTRVGKFGESLSPPNLEQGGMSPVEKKSHGWMCHIFLS